MEEKEEEDALFISPIVDTAMLKASIPSISSYTVVVVVVVVDIEGISSLACPFLSCHIPTSPITRYRNQQSFKDRSILSLSKYQSVNVVLPLQT